MHLLDVVAQQSLRLILTSLEALGVSTDRYAAINYEKTQEIGDAVAFLGCDGLLVPSARWPCENLVLFPENLERGLDRKLNLLRSDECDWLSWARENGLVDAST